MIRLTHESRILLAIAPADFRAGIDGMSARCRQVLEHDPSSGAIVVFINRAHTMVRALTYDGNGYWLMTKRLSRGRFKRWPGTPEALTRVSARELIQLLQCEASEHANADAGSTARAATQPAGTYFSVPAATRKPLASTQR